MTIRYRSNEPLISPRALDHLKQVLDERYLSPGPWVRRFEECWAAVCGVSDAIATSSGTSALYVALRAAGVGPGDEVIVPSMTCPDTVNAVIFVGAAPVLVDIEPVRWGIDPQRLREAVTPRTRAAIPVHLYGCPVVPEVLEQCRARGLVIVEDAAEAHGAHVEGRKVGALGHAGCFSFRGEKLLGIGTGGMLTTNDPQIAARARRVVGLAGQGGFDRYFSTEIGYSCELSSLQAALGVAQVDVLEETIASKERIAGWYHELLPEELCEKPAAVPGRVWWKYSVLFNGLDTRALHARLLDRGIEVMPPFAPLYRLPMHRDGYRPADFPVSEAIYQRLLTLPTSPYLTRKDVEAIVETVREVAAR